MQLKIPKEKTAEILLMNELKCMLACISVVTAEKIQGHKCTELAEKSWRLAESIEYIWNAEILNPQIEKLCPKHSSAFYRMWIYVSSECTGRTYKSRADPGSSEEISLLLYHYSDLLLPEEMPVYQIPIYQTLQIANMRLERKENHLLCPKRSCLCDLFSAGQNAQLNVSFRIQKTCFSNISIKMYLLHPARQKRRAFSRLFQR
ncbi:MAG: hypothetical protein V8R97_03560 [Fusicatenibacter saccharivorans]